MASTDEQWVPNLDFPMFGTPIIYQVYMRGWLYAYEICIYIGYYLFVVGEVCPKTKLEIFITILVEILSAVMNGILIGNMAMYMYELNKNNA